jgi:hypothetical protein
MWNTKGREIIIIKHACMQKKKKRQWQAHACCTACKTNKGRLPRIMADP